MSELHTSEKSLIMLQIPDVSRLSRKEKIGQLFIVGFRGWDTASAEETLQFIKTYKPGGLILFDQDLARKQPVRNIESPEQVRSLTSLLQQASEIPLLLGIDQEGGFVNRLKAGYGFPPTKSHAELGKSDDVQQTFHEAKIIAETLSEAGINLNFAPVLDLAKNENSSIIAKKERSFGAQAEVVIRHSEAYIKAHLEQKIITCCKHFPGHGSAKGDTHAGFVDVSHTWDETELMPYEHLISQNICPMIMTAHIFNANLDENYPSTLSQKTITGLLRNTLRYEGVIISDDMQMKAISGHFGLKEALKRGFLAGLDMFCFGNNLFEEEIQLKDLVTIMEELLDEHEISESRLDESVARILKLKNDLE